ncbi:hypothetical protein Dimus_005176 [Dionaea muscipula]
MDSQLTNWISNPLALAASITVLFFAVKFLANKIYQKKKIKYAPIAGTMLNHLLNLNRLHDYMTHLAARYTTYRILAPTWNEIYTSDPANVEYILKSNFHNYGKGLRNYKNLSDLLGDGIFTVDGEKWRHQRKISSYEFSKKVQRDYSSIVFCENAAKLANVVAGAANSNQIVDIQDLFMKSTMDSIFKVAFGVDLGTMCGTSEEGTKFSHAFDDASSLIVQRYFDPLWPMKKFLNLGSEAKLKKSVQVIDNFVYKLIDKAVMQKHNSHDSSSSMKKEDILSRFLQSNTDPKYLRDLILNLVIAGKDTTAGTLSWFIYMLCKNPEIQEKVVQDIRSVTKVLKVTSYAEFAASLNDQSLENMQYLHAALTETLRLYPAVPSDTKICFSDDTLPDGHYVKKGDSVVYQPYAMGRMKFIWGADAEIFRPERWLNEDGIFQPESPFKFTAFQAGPRICLGKEFAYRQMKIFCAVLLSSFIFKLGDEKKPVTYRTMLTLHIDGGLHVRAFPR